MPYLLIKDGVVVNSIVADESFLEEIKEQYDEIVEIDNKPGDPGVEWKKVDKDFVPPDPKPELKENLNIGGVEFNDDALRKLAEAINPKLKELPVQTVDPEVKK